ncbi:hypothetical protein SAMN04489796_102197 [Winogradskyella thalassocola]|uniref:Uncharacterized protein n=1 Tax=Winogradskyella thalassocola TaxID=262004 RepID=A0A1G8B9Y1_9FLAO|nr:hypothetical protein SAMN04489796_102197 [Winogradskyella thalassocola]
MQITNLAFNIVLSELPRISFNINRNGDVINNRNILNCLEIYSNKNQSSHPQSVLPIFLASLNVTLSTELLQLESPRQDFE